MKIILSNKWFYTFVLFVVLSFSSFFVLSATEGTDPVGGHGFDELGAPSGCGANQVVQYLSDGSWGCVSLPSVSSTEGLSTDGSGNSARAFYESSIAGLYGRDVELVGADSSFDGGSVRLLGGDSDEDNGGDVVLTAGDGDYGGGDVVLTAGDGLFGTAGNVVMIPGSAGLLAVNFPSASGEGLRISHTDGNNGGVVLAGQNNGNYGTDIVLAGGNGDDSGGYIYLTPGLNGGSSPRDAVVSRGDLVVSAGDVKTDNLCPNGGGSCYPPGSIQSDVYINVSHYQCGHSYAVWFDGGRYLAECTARCPEDYFAISGGCSSANRVPLMHGSRPYMGNPGGWICEGWCMPGEDDCSYSAYAVCMKAPQVQVHYAISGLTQTVFP